MAFKDPLARKAYNQKYYQQNRDRIREQQNPNSRRYFQNNREKVRAYRLSRDYGITAEIYAKMLEEQQGGCAICRSTDPGKGVIFFSVDHDHVTKKVRGLLCTGCNSGIGYLKDDLNLLRSSVEYLQKHAELSAGECINPRL